jgi:hypothetical protein
VSPRRTEGTVTRRTPPDYGSRSEVTPIDLEPTDFTEHGTYEIRIVGLLDATWARRFEGLTTTAEATGTGPPTTLLRETLRDRAALHGILDRIRDLDVQLLMVRRVERP